WQRCTAGTGTAAAMLLILGRGLERLELRLPGHGELRIVALRAIVALIARDEDHAGGQEKVRVELREVSRRIIRRERRRLEDAGDLAGVCLVRGRREDRRLI